MADKDGQKDGQGKKDGAFKRAVREAEALSGASSIVEDGFVLYQYPDYDTYKAVQTAGNKAKLRRQFVKESHVVQLAAYLDDVFPSIDFGLCHGTRSGAEQAWFSRHLKGAPKVIGTEISDTANQFANTVQWDFHQINPDWSKRCDFVYSNSWDHAFDPVKAFGAWIDALKPGGRLLLDYTKGQSTEASNALDPFGVSYERLCTLLDDNFSGVSRRLPVLDYRKSNPEYRARVVVLERTG
jgi:SAM-dependent methyltransferase